MDAASLMQAESSAAVASGHLLFNREGTLMAVPFDATARAITGDPFPVAERVAREGSRYASFSMSETGVLVYGSGIGGRPATRLTWMDRTGRALGAVGEAALYDNIAMSSDGRKIAVVIVGGAPENRDIWIVDAARATQTRFTFDPADDSAPVWSPDDRQIVFQAIRDGANSTLRQKRVDGTTEDAVFPSPVPGPSIPTHWSADGRHITYMHNPGTGFSYDVWALPLFGERKPFRVATTPFSEAHATFSPDGKWIAFQSNESGQTQVYVQAFPAASGKYMVSKDGGWQPVWRPDGKELFFLSLDARLMAASVDPAGPFQAGIPAALFPVTTFVNPFGTGRHYAVTRDGKRFLINVVQQPSRNVPLTVVVNWLASVQK